MKSSSSAHAQNPLLRRLRGSFALRALLLIPLLLSLDMSWAWTTTTSTSSSTCCRRFSASAAHTWIGSQHRPRMAVESRLHAVEPKAETSSISQATSDLSSRQQEEEDDDEYEYIEYDNLTEAEFVGSEWLIGTNWDGSPNRIGETWVRLIVDKDGKNLAIWGDNSQGSWNLDVATQFLSISKENTFAGKEIWACTVSDYYYLQGTVRGWKYWSAAEVLGQWQGRRLGVDPEEAGVAPWFEEQNEQQDIVPSTAQDDEE